jgi:uncharacterized protein with PIN domain
VPYNLNIHLVSNNLKSVSMAILNLDKLVINRTVIGINCNKCGGFLNPVQKRSITGKIIKLLTLGTIKSKLYECDDCKKLYMLI